MSARYGTHPLHLLGHVLLFALAAFALDQIISGGDLLQLAEWYLGFALVQDLVLIPLYSLLDRTVTRRSNHLRVPALLSGLLLLVYAPLILGLGRHTYRFYGGHPAQGYLRNWLLVSAGLFAVSALVYSLRRWRAPG